MLDKLKCNEIEIIKQEEVIEKSHVSKDGRNCFMRLLVKGKIGDSKNLVFFREEECDPVNRCIQYCHRAESKPSTIE